jgi:putative transposase
VLRENEAGARVDDVCRRQGISTATFYAWRNKYGSLMRSEMKRLRGFEVENVRLKRIVADQMRDMKAMQDLQAKKLVTRMAKRKAMGFLMTEMSVSERPSCRIFGLARSVRQYRPVPCHDAELIARLWVLAAENCRYGCPRLHAMRRREGMVLNHKRTERLDHAEGLQVRTNAHEKPPAAALPRADRGASGSRRRFPSGRCSAGHSTS